MPHYAQKLKSISVKNCDKNNLIDIQSVKIDENKSKHEKLIDYITKVKNPYLFKLGNLAVKVTFNNSGKSLQQQFEDLILANLGN